VAVALSRFFATFIRDVPRMTKVVERNTTVLDMLGQLREDMDLAVALPDAVETYQSDDRSLLIELPNGAIHYRIEQGGVARAVLGDEEAGQRRWHFPEAVVAWSRWKQGERPYAVEIRTLVRQRIGSKLKDKMVNSHVLFVPDTGKDGELR
jgi:hypothetical protein